MTDRARAVPVVRVSGDARATDQDLVAAEAPLALDVTSVSGDRRIALGLMMRTPGDDEDLAVGFLQGEGVVTCAGDVAEIRREAATGDRAERLTVVLAASIDLETIAAARAGLQTSACGLCGRLSLNPVPSRPGAPGAARAWPADLLAALPARLEAGQPIFAATGGLHAAALFGEDGAALVSREDVGRHNAVDKVLGAALRQRLPVDGRTLLVVSGRVAFEIVQKAAAAGLGAIVAVGAPSSLAIDAARAAGLLLAGFARDGRFNVYAGHGGLK
jgi:FdhD protein